MLPRTYATKDIVIASAVFVSIRRLGRVRMGVASVATQLLPTRRTHLVKEPSLSLMLLSWHLGALRAIMVVLPSFGTCSRVSMHLWLRGLSVAWRGVMRRSFFASLVDELVS